MNRPLLAALLCTLAPLVACGGDFAPGSRLQKLRVLGLRADQPYAPPGTEVALEPLVFNPEARPLAWAVATCSDPSDSSVSACLSQLDGPFDLIEGDPESDGLTVPIPDDALSRLPEGKRSGALIGIALVACPGAIERGTTGYVPVVCRDAAGEALALSQFEVAVKRLFVREADRNENPRLEALTWDGEPWPEDEVREAEPCAAAGDDIDDCPEGLRHRVGVALNAPETGVDEHGTRFGEQLIVSAYGSAGIFEHPVRIGPDAEHRFAAQQPDGSDEITLFFVARDDRGGIDWAVRSVRVR